MLESVLFGFVKKNLSLQQASCRTAGGFFIKTQIFPVQKVCFYRLYILVKLRVKHFVTDGFWFSLKANLLDVTVACFYR